MKRSRSVRAYIVGLVAAVALPLLAFGSLLLIRSAQNEQHLIMSTAVERARGAAADLHRELRNLQALATVVASSSSMLADDVPLSYLDQIQTVKLEDVGFIVTDLSGQSLFNTCNVDNRILLLSRSSEYLRDLVNGGKAFISDLMTEPISGEPLLTIDLPVWRGGNSAYLLSLCALPRILRVLEEQHLPYGWSATVIDRQQRAIAGITEGAAGSLAAAGEHSAAIAAPHQVSILSLWHPSGSGYSAFSPVDLAAWTVAVTVPGEAFFAPIRRSLLVLFLAGGGTLLLVIALAVTIGRRIAGPIAGLEGIAAALEDGRWVAPAHTGIQETDLVARALCSASRDLNRRREELSQTAGALRLSERRLQVLSEDLLRAVTERTKLLDRMVTTQETERRRIARELHDRLGQYVAAILLGLNVADQALRCDQKGQQNLAELKALTSAMSREVHELSWELRPTALDDLGLEAVVADYLAEWSERFHLDVDFVSNLHGKRLSPPIEMTLYRVLQEAMTNVAKHACANKVGVILEANEGEGRLIVEDDGIGFGGERSGAAAVSMSGFGLINIRERLSLVGGSLSIETAPNRGTTLFCRVPQ